MGVEVAYTELDIRHASLPASSSALATQGNDYANVVGSCLDVPGCLGVSTWGLSDKYSWVPQTFAGAGDALLYNSAMSKKPAWTSVSSVLRAAATSITSTGTTMTTTTRLSSATTLPATSTTPGGSQQTHWGQCGGSGWGGATTCQSPWTCQKLNDWYYQCL